MADLKEQFVWTDYAAPWCRPCLAQAPIINALKSEFQSIPTQQTAEGRARRFKLDRARVIVAKDRWGMTILTHILFSPTGQRLSRAKGFLSEEQIQTILDVIDIKLKKN